MADINHLCLGCMEDKGSNHICPHCGWVTGAAAEAPQHLPPGTILHEKYLLGRVLGHGGFGITYLAWDLNLDMKLAIKEYMPRDFATRSLGHTMVSVFSGSLNSHFEHGLNKFLDEAKTLAQYNNHPGIVGVRDFFRENGTAYLVMYYLEGVDFKQYLETQGGKVPYQTALMIMMPVMDALREVHRSETLHRDISPDNIYITAEGQVKVLDFGAARHAITEFSKSISVILKPGYAPEEQYRSKGKQGPWTDVYATAATFYRAIVGHVPPESLDRLEEDAIIPPSKLGVDIPAKAEAALMKALSVKAADRFQSMDEFQQELLENLQVTPSSEKTEASNNLEPINQVTKAKASPPKDSANQAPKRKGISKWVWIGGGAAVAILLFAGIFAATILFGAKTGKEIVKTKDNPVAVNQTQEAPKPVIKQVTVPNIMSIREEEAKNLLEKEGLKLGNVTYVESLFLEKGWVMKQSIDPDQKVNENDLVHLEVSKGIELPVDEETIKVQKLSIVNEYWDKGYNLDIENKMEEALKYYIQARDMAKVLYEVNEYDFDAQYSIGVLYRNISIIKSNLGYYEYALKDIEESVDILEDLLEEDPIFQDDYVELANSYGMLSYIQFLNKMPNDAIEAAELALELDPSNIVFKANLAHAYLFSNQFNAAVALYSSHQNELVSENELFKDFVLADFKYFKEKNLTHPDMQKIEDMYNNPNIDVYSDELEIEITIYANGFAFEDEDVETYLSTIDPSAAGLTEQSISSFFKTYDEIQAAIESIEVLEIKGDTAKAKVVQTLTYTDGTQNYEAKSTLIHSFIRSDGIFKWLISATEVEGG
ncbi:protein kinase [Bacillus sp. DTU_2020_1000418_1_SI_GHA_SEK_038]|uniref:protein kinase domain-containing protein n=1 Tax=Bacillus sp. DTU_2020_1000418_1_SI_GHA_SEK_038 TaxID=3077585 RepID=UPI0028E2BA07|nr:protein kinase [Bacillus sp. DTU_2020_1000418_1_SI_GHA_SEK_038]WNS77450.1 protein kinase [Bacillus sp. DTU_2020_1000418_1_SI_GHA_SEK_038]